jgi:hypothetical protein
MKRLLWFLPALLPLAGCNVTIVEPRYDSRDRVTGYYDIEEYSHTYNDMTYYTVQVTKSENDLNELWLSNFYSADIRVYAYVHGVKITIPFQEVNGYEIEGVGTIYSDSSMDLDYSVRDRYNGSKTDFCDTKAWRE